MTATGERERIMLPFSGGCTVRIADEKFQLPGEDSMFARAQIASGAGGRFALAGAKCERRLPARYGPAPEVSNSPGHPACRLVRTEVPRVGRRVGRGRGAVREWQIRFHPHHTEEYR
jgi:hypothetical protein